MPSGGGFASKGPDSAPPVPALGAHAYTQGSHIPLGAAPDLHTIAHESAHVTQQASVSAAERAKPFKDLF